MPAGKFGAARGKSSARSNTAVPSAVDVAVVAATAVLDVFMPCFAGDELAAGLVAEAVQAVRSSLAAAGAGSKEALEAGRRLSAEVARWDAAWAGPVRSSETLDPEIVRRWRGLSSSKARDGEIMKTIGRSGIDR